MKTDYIIVGCGIAGVCFARHCIENKKTFRIYDNGIKGASDVAAGVVNPIVLKRFNPVWQAEEQMELLKKTFQSFEQLLQGKYIYNKPVWRVLANQREAEIWQEKRQQNPVLKHYLSEEILPNKTPQIAAPFGFGQMKETGYIDLSQLLQDFKEKYQKYIEQTPFDYDQLETQDKTYQGINYDHIIFAEGTQMLNNPYFNNLPLVPNKGQVLKLKITEKIPNAILKSKCFLMPAKPQEYYAGATYNPTFDNEEPTEKDTKKIKQQLAHFYHGDYQIISIKTGLRPTVPDRRPLIGEHPTHPGLFLLNGLGTRGTFNGPTMAKILYNHIENHVPIPREIHIERYE